MINPELWQKSLAIHEKLSLNGEKTPYNAFAQELGVSDRLSYSLYFAINNRSLIASYTQTIDVDPGVYELAIGDIHIPYQDDVAINACLNYADQYNPQIISIMGDMLDCYNASSFDKNPLRSKRLFEEIAQGKQFLTMLRERYPKARIIFYQGNHEERIARYILKNAPQIAEMLDGFLPSKLGLSELNIEFHDTPFKIGKLWHLHGHEKPSGQGNPEYVCNVMMQYIYDHFITFHYHRHQDKVFKGLGDRFLRSASVGYLAGDMDYSKMNKWQQGFAIIEYKKDGEFAISNKTIVKGMVY